MNRLTILLAISVTYLTWSLSLGAEPNKRAELGHSQKLRILVDKVMQPEAKWITEEWMIRETAEADFNVYSPRVGHDRLDEVRRVSAWCQKYGIYHMPWMRGSLSAPKDTSADGKRMLWENGSEQPPVESQFRRVLAVDHEVCRRVRQDERYRSAPDRRVPRLRELRCGTALEPLLPFHTTI